MKLRVVFDKEFETVVDVDDDELALRLLNNEENKDEYVSFLELIEGGQWEPGSINIIEVFKNE